MKVRNSKGELKELVIKANDSIPAGAVIDFEGDVVPEGYEQVEDKGEIYSTEEQVIGTWIDGKPLYRKVIDGIVLSGNETIVEQTSGIIVQKIYGYFVYTTNKSIQEIGAYRTMNTASTSRVLWDGTYVKVQGGTDWQTGQYTARVIIEYTKTTD